MRDDVGDGATRMCVTLLDALLLFADELTVLMLLARIGLGMVLSRGVAWFATCLSFSLPSAADDDGGGELLSIGCTSIRCALCDPCRDDEASIGSMRTSCNADVMGDTLPLRLKSVPSRARRTNTTSPRIKYMMASVTMMAAMRMAGAMMTRYAADRPVIPANRS